MTKIHKTGRKAIDLTDQEFGKLIVLRRANNPKIDSKRKEAYWLCKCECGEEKVIKGKSLRLGYTKSCGCHRRERFKSKLINLVGRRFGRLVVIKRVDAPPNDKTNKPYWLCKCDCGNSKVIFGANLREGLTKSCGCIRKKYAWCYSN